MTAGDGRIWAWTRAYKFMESAEKLRTDGDGHTVNPLPEVYWAAMWEAQTWALLAQTDTATGFLAGDFIQSEIKRLQAEQDDRDDMMQRIREYKKKDGETDGEPLLGTD